MLKFYNADIVGSQVPAEAIPPEVRAQFLRPGELLSVMKKFPVAFQPLGTLEWHGRHNPIGCDAIKAEHLCIETAKRTGGVVMPAVYFSADTFRDCGKGFGQGMDAEAGFQLPGSFYHIETGLLKAFMLNACKNYLDRGFRLVVIVSGHNPSIQKNLMDEVCYLMKLDTGEEPVQFIFEFEAIEEGNPRRSSDHAGGYETSMMLHLAGDRVNMRANDGLENPKLAVYEEFPIEQATAEEGKIRFELQVDGLSAWVNKKMQKLAGD